MHGSNLLGKCVGHAIYFDKNRFSFRTRKPQLLIVGFFNRHVRFTDLVTMGIISTRTIPQPQSKLTEFVASNPFKPYWVFDHFLWIIPDSGKKSVTSFVWFSIDSELNECCVIHPWLPYVGWNAKSSDSCSDLINLSEEGHTDDTKHLIMIQNVHLFWWWLSSSRCGEFYYA